MANEFKIKNGLVVSGSADIEQDLTVRGKIIADQLNISIVSSSVLYESGSTKFGDSIDDNHAFTGSINITGSINLNGQTLGTGKLDETTFNSFTSSYNTVSGSINNRLGSLESFSSSIDSNFVSEGEFGTHTGSLNSFTSSTLMTIGALNNESASIRGDFNSFTSSYTNVSTSLNSRIGTLETYSGSYTGSFKGDGTNLFNIPASGVTGLNLTQIADGSVTASVSNTNGLRVNSKTEITGSLIVTNGITGSIDYSNITNKPTLVSGSSQIDVTMTTGYSTFSSSIATTTSGLSSSIGGLSSSVATTDSNQNTRLGLLETSTGSLNTFTSSASGRLTSLETTSGSINTFTASALTRVTAIETATGSLNTFTSSASGRLTSLESASSSIRTDLNSFTSSANGRLTSLESASSSIRTDFNSFTSSNNAIETTQNGRLTSLESTTGSLNTFTSSASGRLTSLETTSGSINTFTASALTRVTAIETSTGSLNTFTSSAGGRLTSLESASSSIRTDFNSFTSSASGRLTSLESASSSIRSDFNSFTSSNNSIESTQNGRLTALETTSGSINTFTSSALTRVTAIETATSSLNSFTSSINTTIKSKLDSEGVISGSVQVNITGTTGYSTFSSSISSSIGSLSSSIATTDANQNTRLGNLETTSGSINTFTASALTRVTAIETATSSLNSFTSSIATTIKNKLNTEGVVSGSSQIDVTSTTNYTSFSSSIATTDLNQNNRLSSIEGKSGSYATTGSNTFVGSQTVSGSLIITQNLTVFGSSSITYVTSSQLRIDDNIITVNTSSPGQRFGGIEVYDSGSVIQATGSILWDSVNNRWIYQQSSEATYGGGVLMSGPRSSGSLGSELTLTSGRVAKSAGGDHLNDSNITDNGTTVSINSNTEITGSLLVTSTIVSQTTPLVSGSGQISFNGITDKPTLISGSSQVLNGSGVWSGSAQLPAGVVSGSSQVLNGSGVWSGSAQLPSGVVSGSSQITYSGISGIPSGIVSGSSQIAFGSITGVPSGLVSGSSQVLSGTGIWSGSAQLPSGVVSGSSQVLAGTTIHSGSFFNGISVVSGSGQISFGGITGVPSGLVSGSSQVAFGSITGVPSGLVSGSSQITYGSLTGIPSGIVSGSSQVTFGSITGVPSGLVSGSSQIAFGSITGVPSGLVSGSSQITLSSTTGFGSYLNQAVLTTSSPSFSNITASGDLTVNNSSTIGRIYLDGAQSGHRNYMIQNGIYGISNAGFQIRDQTAGANLVYFDTSYNATFGAGVWATSGNFSAAISASNFSGSSSGTNTGDQTNITGNAGTATLAANSTLWNGASYNGGAYAATTDRLLAYDLTNSQWRPVTASQVQTLLGLGTMAYAATSSYYLASNPSGYITGISFANVSSKPTTISGYGITDAITTGNIASQSVSTSTYSSYLNALTNYSWTSSSLPQTYHQGITSAFVGPSEGWQNYGSVMTMRTYSGGGGSLQLYTPYGPSNGGDSLQVRFGNYSVSGGNSWTGWKTLIDSGTIGSQSVSYASTAGALTSMNISQFTNNSGYITGISFANVSSKPTTISGYGITDAITTGNIGSQSVSYATSAGSATSATSATFATNSSKLYSTDASYSYTSGAPYYGYLTYDGTYWQFKVSPATPANVRVYTADTLGGNSANQTGGANTIVQRDGNGYIQTSYYYASGGGSERNTSGMGYFAGHNTSDYYYRSYTAAAAAALLSGQSMNISGTATNITAYTINQSVGSSNRPTFAGIYVSDSIIRTAAGTGYLSGGYAGAETGSSTGAIYTIGGSYYPTSTSLNNMYGIGYTNISGNVSMTSASGWGMYVAANGTPYVWLGAEGNASVFRGNILPHSNNSYNLGSASYGWANVYTNDLHLSNMNKPEGNDIDGTNGNWTIQEGEENLYIINNRNGKKFKISLEEIK
jgi:hypothetical protein